MILTITTIASYEDYEKAILENPDAKAVFVITASITPEAIRILLAIRSTFVVFSIFIFVFIIHHNRTPPLIKFLIQLPLIIQYML